VTVPIALTHVVSPRINQCELSHLERRPIDYDLAVNQHRDYCALLKECGLKVIELDVNRDFPDGTFIEDTALAMDEIAVMARSGAASRRGEARGIEPVLARYRPIAHVEPPATFEGGDILRVGKRIFAGLSARTNAAGMEALHAILQPLGYEVIPVEMKGCLHLKSAVTALDDQVLLANPAWFDNKPFEDYRIIAVPDEEPHAANALRIGNTICLHDGYRRTVDAVRADGFEVKTVDISELLKAEAGLTCSSILL
jgi:dimethylargininase